MQHMEAAINIGVGELKARFGGLLKDESTETPLDSFRVPNADTWQKTRPAFSPLVMMM